jgi:hydroxyacylglutathione hydrolase
MWFTDRVALVGSGEARLTNQYDCNVYAIDAPDGVVVVDSGSGLETERLLQRIDRELGEPSAVVLTHAHADHSQGIPDFPDQTTIYAGVETAALIGDGNTHRLGIDAAIDDGVYPGDYEYRSFDPDETFGPGETLSIAGLTIETVPVAGHADDHVCYVVNLDDHRACFSGDVVYPDGSISLLNVPGSSLEAYRRELPRLLEYDLDALFTGHGLPRVADAAESIEIAVDHLHGMFVPPSTT